MTDKLPTGFTPAETSYMAEALQLAELGRYTAHPNPRVGCILVNGHSVVGRGYHEKTGDAHAEVNALADAGSAAKGATVYVTLEPCAHDGLTPPCCDALIGADVSDVVVAMEDPNPKVRGAGSARLREAGISVRTGLLAAQARGLNKGFLSRIERGRPWLTLKMAASLDGATAMLNGESQWITGPEARADVQRLRAESGAIMTGIGTVLADDPSLTVRNAELTTRQPLRVVVDSQLRMPPAACMIELDGQILVFCANDDNVQLPEAKVCVVRCASEDGTVDLKRALAHLGRLDINDVLVEAGPVLAGALLSSGLVDELVIYQAPHIMGSETRGMFATPAWTALADRSELTITDVRKVGKDTRITATP